VCLLRVIWVYNATKFAKLLKWVKQN